MAVLRWAAGGSVPFRGCSSIAHRLALVLHACLIIGVSCVFGVAGVVLLLSTRGASVPSDAWLWEALKLTHVTLKGSGLACVVVGVGVWARREPLRCPIGSRLCEKALALGVWPVRGGSFACPASLSADVVLGLPGSRLI